MQLMVNCTHCRTPFSIKEPEISAALAEILAKNFKYYTASCPNCGKPNKVPAIQLRRVAPRSPAKPAAKTAASRPKAARKTASSPKAKTKSGGASRKKSTSA
jgi:hypothetical protein